MNYQLKNSHLRADKRKATHLWADGAESKAEMVFFIFDHQVGGGNVSRDVIDA